MSSMRTARQESAKRPGLVKIATKDKVFLDTNIFIYSIDSSPQSNRKRDTARELVKEHVENGSGVISIQVLQEFYQVATRKIEKPILTEDALQFMHYMSAMDVVIADFDMMVASIHLHRKYSLSFWDALILQATKSAGCSQVLSEDLHDAFGLDGMLVKNPFST